LRPRAPFDAFTATAEEEQHEGQGDPHARLLRNIDAVAILSPATPSRVVLALLLRIQNDA
jgi:hypothetical protein